MIHIVMITILNYFRNTHCLLYKTSTICSCHIIYNIMGVINQIIQILLKLLMRAGAAVNIHWHLPVQHYNSSMIYGASVVRGSCKTILE